MSRTCNHSYVTICFMNLRCVMSHQVDLSKTYLGFHFIFFQILSNLDPYNIQEYPYPVTANKGHLRTCQLWTQVSQEAKVTL